MVLIYLWMVAGLRVYKEKLFEPIDNTPLVLFRILIGLILAAEGFGAILTGWVRVNLVEPEYHFPFMDFEFLSFWYGPQVYVLFVLLGISGILISLGYYYRIATIVYFLLWTSAYLMQKTSYNNHYYLMVLLSFILIIVPANASMSIDAKRNPDIRSSTCESWVIWLFIAQMAIFYSFASIAKWNPDWVGYNSVEQLFYSKYDYPIIGSLLQKPLFQKFIAWGGIAFDFLIVPAMLWKKTRKLALVSAFVFHLFNSVVFQIGVFPYMALVFMVFFYSGDELKKIIKSVPDYGNQLKPRNNFQKQIISSALVISILIQVILPLRHHLIPGDVNWTEEGHRMSWRMMLRVKSGHLKFKMIDSNSNRIWYEFPEKMLTPKQASRVWTRPDFCYQFVQILKEKYSDINPEIYARGRVSLNGGPFSKLFREDVDLAKVEWNPFQHSSWVYLYSGQAEEELNQSK